MEDQDNYCSFQRDDRMVYMTVPSVRSARPRILYRSTQGANPRYIKIGEIFDPQPTLLPLTEFRSVITDAVDDGLAVLWFDLRLNAAAPEP